MRLCLVFVVGAVLLNDASAGPIWDRARKMFGWDKPEDSSGNNHNVAVAPHYPHGGPHGYPVSAPAQYKRPIAPAAPPRGAPSYASGPSGYPSAGYRAGSSYVSPDLQNAQSGQYGSYAAPSYAGPSYAKVPFAAQYAAYSGAPAYASASGYGGNADYGAPSAANNYGGLFSVVDQTSHIGQLANGDLAASPSEHYGSTEDVMKSLLKLAEKPFDLETAATGGHYYNQIPQLALNPGPHPIMEADRNIIRYRTSPIKIGVADAYGQSVLKQTAHPIASYGHSAYSHLSYGAAPTLASSGFAASYGGDLHSAASTLKKSVTSKKSQ